MLPCGLRRSGGLQRSGKVFWMENQESARSGQGWGFPEHAWGKLPGGLGVRRLSLTSLSVERGTE